VKLWTQVVDLGVSYNVLLTEAGLGAVVEVAQYTFYIADLLLSFRGLETSEELP
jgi:hypothetical protein